MTESEAKKTVITNLITQAKITIGTAIHGAEEYKMMTPHMRGRFAMVQRELEDLSRVIKHLRTEQGGGEPK